MDLASHRIRRESIKSREPIFITAAVFFVDPMCLENLDLGTGKSKISHNTALYR